MKNQHLGDINDYAKYGMLRAFGREMSVAVIWMMTPDDGSNDGRHTDYLQYDGRRFHDPELFDWLRRWYREGGRRDVRLIESGLLPNCRFFGEVVPDDVQDRAAWFARAREFARGADLVFLDPDNGLPVKSVRPGTPGWSKYVGWQELEAIYDDGQPLLVYQHMARIRRGPFIEGKLREIYVRTGSDQVTAFTSFGWMAFLLNPPSSRVILSEAVHRITVDWYTLVSVWNNRIVPMDPADALRGRKIQEAHMPPPLRPKSTDIGYVNDNGQEVIERTDRKGTDRGQRVYILRWHHSSLEYGANGTDIWIRKCPFCQGGKPGIR